MAGKIFGCPIPSDLPHLDAQLLRYESSACHFEQAIAENCRLDDRVGDQHTEQFLTHVSRGSPDPLSQTFSQSVSFEARQAFHRGDIDVSNLVFSPQYLARPILGANTRLVSIVWVFDALLKEMRTYYRRQRRIGHRSARPAFEDWLRSLTRPDNLATLQSCVRESYAALVRRQRANGNNSPHARRLVWVGLQREFRRHEGAGPVRWLEIFGLGHHLEMLKASTRPQWFLRLNYTAKDANLICRPTTLYAHIFNGWHFPTKKSTSARNGGKTVVLGEALARNVSPMSEFVHAERMIATEDVRGLYEVNRAQLAAPVDLQSARSRHRQWLTEKGLI